MFKLCRFLLPLAALMMSACASTGASQRLEDNVYAYAQAMRWSDYIRAANFIHPDDRPSEQQLAFQISRLENMRVVGYREVVQRAGPSPGLAEQLVELRVVNKHTLAERMVRDRQIWRYDEDADRWWLMSGLPNFSQQ